jgi:hypothetical protein
MQAPDHRGRRTGGGKIVQTNAAFDPRSGKLIRRSPFGGSPRPWHHHRGTGEIKGYLVRPASSAKLPVVLVVHQNRGLNTNVATGLTRRITG